MPVQSKLLSAIATAGLCCLIATGANAASTTVTWNGPSNFNDAEMFFGGINANAMTITGLGTYEGANDNSGAQGFPTNFSLSLQWGGQWHEVDAWALSNNDFNTFDLNTKGNVSFALSLITGIQFESHPDGVKDGPHTLDFNYRNVALQFNFDGPNAAPEVGQTPLPAALPLMATVLIGAGAAAWRRRRAARAG